MRTIGAVEVLLTLGLLVEPGNGLAEETGAARVVLPLQAYEKLRPAPAKAAPSLTFIDSVRLSGTFRDGKLKLALEGRSVGERSEAALLSEVAGFSLHRCEGTGLIRRAGPGLLWLLPLSDRFRVACEVALQPAAERLTFRAAPTVLFVDARVSDGRLEPGDEDENGLALTLLRTTETHEVQPVTATGRYRITLLPDEVRFRYELALHNPNRGSTSMEVALRSGERVERVEPAAGQEDGGTLQVEAAPGDSTLAIEGRLAGERFVPPLEANAQLVLVETHPLVKAVLDGPSRRVSPGEVGVATQFRGGQGFLLHAREGLSWKVSVVESLRTDDALVRRIQHRVFIDAEGRSLSEAELVVDNQGAPDLKVTAREPLFASAQGAPVLLMPEPDGLRIPLEPGTQQLLVQHRGRIPAALGFALCRVPLLTTPVESSAQAVELRLPAGWVPLAVRFGDAWSSQIPGRPLLLWLVLLVLLCERALAWLGLPLRPRLALAFALALAGLTTAEILAALLGALALCGLLWIAARVPVGRLTLGRVVGALVLLAGLLLFLGWREARREWEGMASGGAGGLSSGYLSMPSAWGWLTAGLFPQPSPYPMLQRGFDRQGYGVEAAPPPPQASGPGASPRPSPTYRGLPVRRPIPPGVREVDLSQDSPGQPRLFLMLIASAWLTSLRVGLVLVAGAVVARNRRALLDGLQAAFSRIELGPAASGALTPPSLDVAPAVSEPRS